MEISHSKIQTWRRCKRKYHYKYTEKLETTRKGLPLVRGGIIHDLLDERANQKDWREKLDEIEEENGRMFDEEIEIYGDIIGDCGRIMEGYERHYGNSIVKDSLKPMKLKGFDTFSEFEFEVELESDVIFVGIIDMIVKDSEKRVWILRRR